LIVFSSEEEKKGGGGVVRKGIYQSAFVAIKHLYKRDLTDEEEKEFLQEIYVQSKLRHPNIIFMYGYTIKDKCSCLITEYVSNGDLTDYLYDKDIEIGLLLRIELCLAISYGMMYLHTMNIIHRDLKPANILVKNFDLAELKICDFGSFEDMKAKNSSPAFGTLPYSAPEKESSPKVDVYSFAMILWEMYTRRIVWSECNQAMEIRQKVESGKRPMDSNVWVDCNEIRDMMRQCWHPNPANRKDFETIISILKHAKKSLTKNQRSSTPLKLF